MLDDIIDAIGKIPSWPDITIILCDSPKYDQEENPDREDLDVAAT